MGWSPPFELAIHLAATQPLTLLSWYEVLNATTSRRASRMAISRNACRLLVFPSDLSYADVARRDGSFDDWNARKDGFHATYFGEVRCEKNKSGPINFDRIDYRPELAVGRWPVDSEAEVRMVTEKTIAYDLCGFLLRRGPRRKIQQ